MIWGDLYGLLVTATGWTWSEIDNLTLPQVYDLDDYWRVHPPLHLLVAAFAGYKSPSRRPGNGAPAKGKEEGPSIEEMMAGLGLRMR